MAFLRRLLGQDYMAMHVYVVDSASTDGTHEAITSAFGSAVTLIKTRPNHYWTGATNAGVAAALSDGCDYVLTLNDDAIFDFNYVSSLVRTAQINQSPVTGSLICYAKEPGRIWAVGAYNDWHNGNFVQLRHGNLWEDEATDIADRDFVDVDYLCGNGTLIQSSVFSKIGMYDERYCPHYHADSEFTMRCEATGITRGMAVGARIYNIFTEENDGPLARKNIRFFSLRSANYVRPILYLLYRYCPLSARGKALLYYYERYIPTSTLRMRSKLLRAAALISAESGNWKAHMAKLMPPIKPALRLAEDLDILRNLGNSVFLHACYLYFLERRPDESGLENYQAALAQGTPKGELILTFADSAEFHARGRFTLAMEHRFLMTGSGVEALTSDHVRELDDEVFVLACYVYLLGRIPDRTGFHVYYDHLCAGMKRKAVATAIAESPEAMAAVVEGKVKASVRDRFLNCLMPRSQEPIAVHSIFAAPAEHRLQVSFNVDVLCMAAVDPKARTGVYRYASSILQVMIRADKVVIDPFCSPDVQEHWSQHLDINDWSRCLPTPNTVARPTSNGVLFFPYFSRSPMSLQPDMPKLLTIHDVIPLMRPEWFTEVAAATFRRQIREIGEADRIVCMSEATRQDLANFYPRLAMESSVIHEAAGPLFIPADHTGIAKARECIGIAADQKYLLTVGTIEPRKNIISVMKAFTIFRRRTGLHKIVLAIVGQKGWLPDSELARKEMNDIDFSAIRLLGYVPDEMMSSFYSGAVCTVFPSLYEGFGLPIVESFCCGTPVITSNSGSMPEIAGDAGCKVDAEDIDALADAIEKMCTDEAYRQDYAARAVIRGQSFSWERAAEEHLAVMSTLVENRKLS